MFVGIILCLLLIFPQYACFWILIATTGTFQMICIMNYVIIQKAFVVEQTCHFFPPKWILQLIMYETWFVHALEKKKKKNLYYKICVTGFLCMFNFTIENKYILFLAVFLSSHSGISYHVVCFNEHSGCVYLWMLDCLLKFAIWWLVPSRDGKKLERPPKILCSNWNCFIFSLIN